MNRFDRALMSGIDRSVALVRALVWRMAFLACWMCVIVGLPFLVYSLVVWDESLFGAMVVTVVMGYAFQSIILNHVIRTAHDTTERSTR